MVRAAAHSDVPRRGLDIGRPAGRAIYRLSPWHFATRSTAACRTRGLPLRLRGVGAVMNGTRRFGDRQCFASIG